MCEQGESCLYLNTKNCYDFCLSPSSDFLPICGGVVEMALDCDGVRFLNVLQYVFVVFLVFSWSVDVFRKLDGTLYWKLKG